MNVAESSGLIRALRQFLPDASWSLLAERPWHSVGFAGTQLRLSADISGKYDGDFAAKLSHRLSTRIFHLDDSFVADIAVTDWFSVATTNHVIVDVLLLDD